MIEELRNHRRRVTSPCRKVNKQVSCFDALAVLRYTHAMHILTYTYRIIIEPDGKYFHAYVPALPGCHTFGKTIAEAKKHIREAIAVYVESLEADGERVPKDESFESFETVALRRQKMYA